MKVGDYVRDIEGQIYKVDENFLKHANIEIKKYSSSIIDLIEENDLLKIEYYSLRYEERVTRLFEVTYKDEKYINLDNAKCDFMLIDGDWSESDKALEPIIKSIVTKEQFSSAEYKVGD